MEVSQTCNALAAQLGAGPIKSPQALAKHIAQQVANHERAREAVTLLRKVIHLTSEMNVLELTVKLEGAQSLLLRLDTATAQESATDVDLTKESRSAENIIQSLRSCQTQLTRIDTADSVFRELKSRRSPQVMTGEILRENCNAIGAIFAHIHSPNEFDLKVSTDGFQIVRRDTNEQVELKEMSTGQRSAYALSLFLAMNARLQQGPKVLLFDDPIAHVDDINILSFLDFLRELAIPKTRQMFFATASTKLAALFRHKFRFLGNRQFREIALEREY